MDTDQLLKHRWWCQGVVVTAPRAVWAVWAVHQHQEAFPSNPPPLLHKGKTPQTDPFRCDFIVVTAFPVRFHCIWIRTLSEEKGRPLPCCWMQELTTLWLKSMAFPEKVDDKYFCSDESKDHSEREFSWAHKTRPSESKYCKVSVECMYRQEYVVASQIRSVPSWEPDTILREERLARTPARYSTPDGWSRVAKQLLEGMSHLLDCPVFWPWHEAPVFKLQNTGNSFRMSRTQETPAGNSSADGFEVVSIVKVPICHPQ